MKRKLAWLLLPLVLCALVWGVKWRADNPTPTKLDLEIRRIMMGSSKVEVVLAPHPNNFRKLRPHKEELSVTELKSFVDTFYLAPQPDNINKIEMGNNGSIAFFFHRETLVNGNGGASVRMNIDNGGEATYVYRTGGGARYRLHRVTRKRWLELFLNHPRIGPELRRRMK